TLEMNEFTKNSIYYGIFRFIRDFMLKHADLVTAVSEGKTKKLKGYVPDKEVITVPNGFDLHFLENKLNPVLYEKMAGQDKCVCVYTGNIGLAQGLRQLLYIAGKAKENKLNVNFWIYGKGAKEQELKEYVRNKQLDNVFFGGKLSNKDIYTVLKAADISFVPLVNEKLKDSIPTKIYEALGVGCPVLLAAKGDAVTVLKEAGLGMAVPPNQLEELWEAFDKMYRNRSRTGHLRDNAVKLMRDKYSIQHSARILADVLKRMWAEERNGVNRKDD
ncbi:MAG TPA: hypothetical protein DCZ40_11435, partial [Lachnospiraceae bacterium]|nr:hypothetical protein [Lachnospiraceae bacterium]